MTSGQVIRPIFQKEKTVERDGGGAREGGVRKERKVEPVSFLASCFEFLSFHACGSQWFKLPGRDGATREYRQPSQDSPGAGVQVLRDC